MTINDTAPAEATPAGDDADLRQRAIKRLKKRRDFHSHLLVYLLVNGFIVVIWAMTGSPGFFWPIFPIVGWGIGLALNAWDVYSKDAFTEDQIDREIRNLHRSR